MRESVTFMGIIDEGQEIALRKLIRTLGTRKLGPPNETTLTQLEGITDLDRLERVANSIFDANSWDELLKPR